MSSADRPGDRLDFEVLLEAGDAVLAPDPTLLVAAKGNVGEVGSAAVEPDEPGSQPASHGDGALQGAGHHVPRQPVLAVVGDADGVLLLVEGDDDEHGAE